MVPVLAILILGIPIYQLAVRKTVEVRWALTGSRFYRMHFVK